MSDGGHRPTKVLLVEAGQSHLDPLEEAFESASGPSMEVEWAGEMSGALELLSEGGIDAVILDPELPDSQGLSSFERMYAFAPHIPIIVLTKDDDEELAVRTVQGGAQDCMAMREAEPNVLVRSVRYAIERHRLLSALRSLSLIDDLTSLYNRRGFNDLGEQYLKLAPPNVQGRVAHISGHRPLQDDQRHPGASRGRPRSALRGGYTSGDLPTLGHCRPHGRGRVRRPGHGGVG